MLKDVNANSHLKNLNPEDQFPSEYQEGADDSRNNESELDQEHPSKSFTGSDLMDQEAAVGRDQLGANTSHEGHVGGEKDWGFT